MNVPKSGTEFNRQVAKNAKKIKLTFVLLGALGVLGGSICTRTYFLCSSQAA
jgi:hypothetical protein